MKTHLGKTLRFLLGVAAVGLVVASCGRDTPTAIQRPSGDLLGWLGNGQGQNTQDLLLSCRPLPYATASAVIGPAGGTLQIGPHTLTVPAGALSQSVLITGTAPSDTVNFVQFSPQGLQFATPASLTMSYANCSILTQLLPKIAYTTDLLSILYYIPSVANLSSQTVTGQVSHFSGYAVAY